MADQNQILVEALRLLADRCPRLTSRCYWAGTSSIAVEELGHRESYDLDFHTTKALDDLRPVLAEIQKAFPGKFEVLQTPDEFGSGFRGVLTLPDGASVTVEALSNYEDVPAGDLVPTSVAPAIQRVSLERYLADKIQCVVERSEARDLFDIYAVLDQRPDLMQAARRLALEQDMLLLAERLLAWTDEEIEKDLRSYPGVPPAHAIAARDLLLNWLRSEQETPQ